MTKIDCRRKDEFDGDSVEGVYSASNPVLYLSWECLMGDSVEGALLCISPSAVPVLGVFDGGHCRGSFTLFLTPCCTCPGSV